MSGEPQKLLAEPVSLMDFPVGPLRDKAALLENQVVRRTVHNLTEMWWAQGDHKKLAAAQEIANVLRAKQWSYRDSLCPECTRGADEGHLPYCTLARALRHWDRACGLPEAEAA